MYAVLALSLLATLVVAQDLPTCPGSEDIATICLFDPTNRQCESDYDCGYGRTCCSYGCGRTRCTWRFTGGLGLCYLPPETGPCRARMPRWYYDSRFRTCRIFIYGGCQGNGNNFRSLAECYSRCYTSPFFPFYG